LRPEAAQNASINTQLKRYGKYDRHSSPTSKRES
jgi:hypothetical protein